jgi:hypothetical protein
VGGMLNCYDSNIYVVNLFGSSLLPSPTYLTYACAFIRHNGIHASTCHIFHIRLQDIENKSSLQIRYLSWYRFY